MENIADGFKLNNCVGNNMQYSVITWTSSNYDLKVATGSAKTHNRTLCTLDLPEASGSVHITVYLCTQLYTQQDKQNCGVEN